jgi:site-specific DNA-methyltransferase (adenine-specific)
MSKKRITWKIEKRKLADLKPHPKNPRQFTEKGMKDLENSINSIGFMQPININQEGTILSGHGRAMKLKQMGETEVDVYVPDRMLTPKQEEEVLVRANANTAGQWDWDLLANEFEDFELTEWGLEIPAIETEELEAKEDDFDGEPPAEPITVLGDLYEIGEHRLLCGDSTCSDTVAKLMNGDKADMVFTDPPYNVAFNGRSGKFDVIKNDDLPENKFEDLIDGFVAILEILKPNNYYAWCNWKFYGILQSKLDFKACIVWAKNVFGLGRGYRHQHEFCLFNGKLDDGINNESDLWEIKKDSKYQHPTQKPVELASRALNNHKADKNIVDLFSGSGLTFIASHQLKRKCYGMELDPKYCDVIIRRMMKLDPSLKITRNGEDCKQEFIEKNA